MLDFMHLTFLSFFVCSALKFGFSSRHVIPPLSLINISVAALTSLFRMQYCHLIKQQTVEQLINITVSALLDERINDINLKDALAPTVKATNKVSSYPHCVHCSVARTKLTFHLAHIVFYSSQ